MSEEIMLKSYDSHEIKLYLHEEGIGYYKIVIPEFSGDPLFVHVLDKNHNILSEQIVQTRMSVGYFDFDHSGTYSAKITNPSKNQVNLQIELGNAQAETMIPPGIMILIGAIIIIVSSYIKLKNYNIEQPDENIL